MYLGYVQFCLIVIMFLQKYIVAEWMLAVAFVLSIAVQLIVGWLDARLGIRTAEYRFLSNTNPVHIEIMQRLERIEQGVIKSRGNKESYLNLEILEGRMNEIAGQIKMIRRDLEA